MTRRIPRRLLPHRGALIVAPLGGVSASGRRFGPPITVDRSLVIDGVALRGTQYGREAEVTGAVYCERSAFVSIPAPDSKVTLWPGTVDEREAVVHRVERYYHPRIADLLVVLLR